MKNTLSTVQALIELSIKSSPTMAKFRESIGVRIASLANTHTLLTHQRWPAISFRDLLQSELAPYTQPGCITLHGDDFELEAEAATTIGMVIHELTTNAAKYGALSSAAGQIAIEWRIDKSAEPSHCRIHLVWQETRGPEQVYDGHKGFGSTLIERLIVKQFGGSVGFDFAPAGLIFRATFQAPVT